MAEKMFPILNDAVIRAIPWAAIAPFEDQAFANHRQTLEQLAERQGLDIVEVVYVMRRKRCDLSGSEAVDELRRAAFRRALINDLLNFELRRSTGAPKGALKTV